MKRYILHLIPAFALALTVAGCGDRLADDAPVPEGTPLKVSLSIGTASTRATSPSLGSEGTVSSVDIVLWTDTEAAPVFSILDAPYDGAGALASCWLDPEAAEAVRSYGGGTLLVLANRPSGSTLAREGSLSAALGSVMGSDLSGDAAPGPLPMAGTATAAFLSDGWTLGADVTLERLVSKLEINVTSVTSPDGTWAPDASKIRVTLRNCLNRGNLSGTYQPGTGDAFDGVRYPLVSDGSSWTVPVPFYTYPSDWSGDAARRMYYVLSVPWSADGGLTWTTCYYQVPVGGTEMKVRANEHHSVGLSISILGSFEEEQPTPLEASATIQPWGASDNDVQIREIRFIMVESTELELQNRTEAYIRYYTSNEVSLVNVSLKHPDLLNGGTVTIPESEYTCRLEDGMVYFSHELNNSGGSEADYEPFVLTGTLRHTDNANYSTTFTISQYPAISVVAFPNSGANVSNSKGYAYVNNGSGSSYGGNPSASGSTSNYNMYIITLTSLPEDSPYVIGDPRSRTVNNFGTWSSNTYDLNGTRRRLSYYHPTESGDRTVNMLSPSFRVASSYGACTKITYANAQKRCASYQEDGFAAGRWRVPTAAEVLYIIGLSEQETIPPLFTIKSGGNGYWCANGSIGATSDNKVLFTEDDFSGTHSVRCVYDEWYWGDEQISPRTNFRWGDQSTF